jgi:LuxR family quorum-sensing transcriptional regulator LasR
MLSCLRDYILESSLKFIKKSKQRDTDISLTGRELECLKWGSMGKTSWEIGCLINCSEATVNFHFGNIRRKFNTNSRQQAVVKAIRLGLIDF